LFSGDTRGPGGWGWRRPLIAALFLTVLPLLLLQLQEGRASAGRAVGVSLDEAKGGVRLSRVRPDLPAARADLQAGDLILEVDGHRLEQISDYDRVAERFTPHREATFKIRRGEQTLEVRVTPGMPYGWGPWVLGAVTVLCYLALAWLSIAQRTEDVRARLLFFLTWAIAVELALPAGLLVGDVELQRASQVLFYLVTGLQFGLELHLVSLLPSPRGWVRRWRWLIPAFYAIGGGLGVLCCGEYLARELGTGDALPWRWLPAGFLLNDVMLPVWAVAVVGLLVVPAWSYPEVRGRHQASLMLLGSLPWAALVLFLTVTSLLDVTTPSWVENLWSPVLLLFPFAIFVAIFRYHLFDIGFVVRRGLIYTTLTTSLLLVFYAALGGGGVLLSGLFGSSSSVWVVAFATLLLGLLFAPLRRLLQEVIDRRFFPERQALRQQLTVLASGLAAQGKLPAMVSFLITRLGEIFHAESVTILVADPKTRVLVAVASSSPAFQQELEHSLLLSPDDPGLEMVRRARRPVPADQVGARSPLLGYRLQALGVELVVPLLHHDELIGALLMGPKHGAAAFTSEELELLDLFSHHVAMVFENARLFTSATYEAMTGLFRREAILEQLQREVERARRYGRPLAVAMADLDHFKSINDRHGHLAGDTVLVRVAQVLTGAIRFSDAIGRYGGEEFLLLLPETELGGAIAVAEKVRRQVEGLRVTVGAGAHIELTLSLGVAALDPAMARQADPATALIALADTNLLRAKSLGRNRVEPPAA
jgi:diguanylate cyclase (GGDEF)-like protein